ncbi:MAG: HesA/MoeB/ThiF family protein [Phycisphaerae bacterium]|nr:HesA/MoeB/ThiF family protein [Phycisphaerae bacterium]
MTAPATTPPFVARYDRQIAFAGLGEAGQQRLSAGTVLVVGVGGLGSWSSQLLARAGVGRLRLVDDDRVELVNLHRQAYYTEADAAAGVHKARAAAAAIGRINSHVAVEPVIERLTADNIASLAAGCDLILDGTDNFPTRFVINDFCVRQGLPWIFAGVLEAEGHVMTVRPGLSCCLRCLHDEPAALENSSASQAGMSPPADPTCREVGVIGPAVAAVAAIQAAQALKLLADPNGPVDTHLFKINLWNNAIQQLDMKPPSPNHCPCCGQPKKL